MLILCVVKSPTGQKTSTTHNTSPPTEQASSSSSNDVDNLTRFSEFPRPETPTDKKVPNSFKSLEIFKGFPKADDRKRNRKERVKGKSIIATKTSEKDAIVKKRNKKIDKESV